MNKTIKFTKEDYDYIKTIGEKGRLDKCDPTGSWHINIGAIQCELSIFEGDFEEDYGMGKNLALNAYLFILGEDDGYGIIKGIPYNLADGGFYVQIKDTYEETLDDIFNTINEEIMENPKLKEAAENTELTWDSIEK